MDRLTEIATSYYEMAKDYKDYFCKVKSIKKDKSIKKELTDKEILKSKIQEYLIGFYNSNQLYYFVKEDKETSIELIKKSLTENFGIMTLYNLIENNITSTTALDEIDTVYKFLYDVMSLEDCCDIAIKKYGNKYKKYCDLYIKMQKLQKDLLDYLKEIYKDN